VFLGEGHAGRHVVLGVIPLRGLSRHLRPDLIAFGAPPGDGGLGRFPGEDDADEGRGERAPALSGMGAGVAPKG
jgi:hypothetical protein